MPLQPYYGQQSVQPQQFMQQMPMNQQFVQQPIQNYQSNAPVMSIAPVSGKENAVQFPVGVGTELWLVDKAAKKIYIKNNSANPREMQELDFEYVAPPQNQNEPVSRSEFEELKGMMGQMMSMMQSGHEANQQRRREPEKNRRRYHDDQSDGSSANNG